MAKKDPAKTGLPGGAPAGVPGGPIMPGIPQVSPFFKGHIPDQMKKGHPGGN